MLQFPLVPPVSQFQSQVIEILALAKSLEYVSIDQRKKERIFHRQLLRSSLFSARIEGNTVTFETAQSISIDHPREKQHQEIANVHRAISTLPSLTPPFSMTDIRHLHAIVMHDLSADAGKFRSESSAIFDGYGNMVYLTPEVTEMKRMLVELISQVEQWSNVSPERQLHFLPLFHYYFEKIHPFIDGNGRTGRVILHYLLGRTTLFQQFILPIDQYFDEHRSEYYSHLEKNTRKVDMFVSFFLDGLIWSVTHILQEIQQTSLPPQSKNVPLLPRREEIFHIIQDHPYISLDSIARRFSPIPRRTISYDVQSLVKKGLVQKHGETRGVCYSARDGEEGG